MKIAIASGKGGTGKTTFAANLAWILAEQGEKVQYLDCDVEEPNGHLFLKPVISNSEAVEIPIPVVNEALCISCRKCAEVCEFHAIAVLKNAMVFPELCHACGGCAIACPTGAIHEEPRAVGVISTGHAGGIAFVDGRMNVGEPMAPPIIRAVYRKFDHSSIALFDAPPGTSCAAVTSVRGSDFVLLVTEPTPFGLNDLVLAVEMVRLLGLPHGVALNRADSGDDRVRLYCAKENIPLLAEFPDDRRLAEAYSRGMLASACLPDWRERFKGLWNSLKNETLRQMKADARKTTSVCQS